MSRLAKKPIIIPEGVTVTLDNKKVTVKGKGGELTHTMSRFVNATIDGATMTFEHIGNSTQSRASWGTESAHVRNMISGVQTPFSKKLIIEGIGYKVAMQGKKLNFSLGFSHPVIVDIPDGLTVVAEKGEITVSGINKAAVGQFTANIREMKKPEPYKGKGIRYSDEVVKRKQGKRAV